MIKIYIMYFFCYLGLKKDIIMYYHEDRANYKTCPRIIEINVKPRITELYAVFLSLFMSEQVLKNDMNMTK